VQAPEDVDAVKERDNEEYVTSEGNIEVSEVNEKLYKILKYAL
jgi:hypothetical protein